MSNDLWAFALLLGVTASSSVRAAQPAEPQRILTLERAVDEALVHQPQMQVSRAQKMEAEASAKEGRAALLPQVSGTAAYSRTTANYVLRPGTLPSSVNAATGKSQLSNQSYNYFNFGVTGQQLIYDFGQTTGRWSAARHKAVAQDANDRVTRLGVVLAVRNAFFQAWADKELMQVAQDTLENQDRHRQQTRGFVEVGTQPQIALAQANTDYANAKVQRITAENEYASARAVLNQAMGREDDLDYDVADDDLPEAQGENADTPALMQEALAARPEFAAAEALIQAQRDTLSSLKGTFGPSLSATAQFTDAGVSLADMGWNWAAGVNLSWPLFAGGLNYNQVYWRSRRYHLYK